MKNYHFTNNLYTLSGLSSTLNCSLGLAFQQKIFFMENRFPKTLKRIKALQALYFNIYYDICRIVEK